MTSQLTSRNCGVDFKFVEELNMCRKGSVLHSNFSCFN